MKKPTITESQRRRLARERKQQAAQRMGVSGDDAPGLTMRIAPEPLRLGTGDTFVPLLVPDRTLKATEGRYPSREIVSRLRRMLGVHTLLALHGLLPLLGTRRAAHDQLAAVAGSGVDRLLREGRQYLSQETAFGSEEALQRFSESKWETLRSAGIDVPWRRGEQIDAELAAVRLVSIAFVRAQPVLAAFEDAQRAAKRRETGAESGTTIDGVSWAAIRDAFGRYPSDLDVGALWQIAAHADINPTVLWPQHIARFAALFEIARFIGRIDRGIEARLASAHFDLLVAIIMETYGPFEDDRATLATVSRVKLRQHFPDQALFDIVGEAKRQGTDIRSTRSTRALALAEAPRARGPIGGQPD